MARRKRVLIIHYFFPPLGGAGVARVVKFVKYLPDQGWEPAIVTTRSTWYGVRDESLVAQIPPHVPVIRARELPIGQLRRRLVNPLHRLGLQNLLHYIGWPDEHCGWFPGATSAALRLVYAWRPDVILSSSYAYTAHFVALAVSRMTGVPWVADFRDEWANNPFAAKRPQLARRLSVAGERAVTTNATRTVVVADWFQLSGAPPAQPIEIPNGVDEDDLTDIPAAKTPPSNRFRLSYVGTMYGPQDCAPVLAALRRLVDRRLLDPAVAELRLVGNVWVDGLEERSPIPVVRTGYVDHATALAEMRSATVLLFYVASSSRAPAGKLYEYLVSKRPILCVARPDNLAYELVSEWDAGAVAAADDPTAIESAVLDLYQRWTAGTLEIGPEVREQTLARFSRRRLTADLASVLEDAMTSRTAR
jgi:hypothetical protein